MTPNQEIEEELRSHIELRAADLERRGLSPAQALREARLEFGSLARFTEEGREAKGWRWRDLLVSTATASARFLRRNPLFALASVLPVTFAVAAGTIVFSAAYIVLQHPLQIPNPDRVYNARLISPEFAPLHPDVPATARHYNAWRAQCKSCEAIAFIDGAIYNHPTDSRRLNALVVSPDFFPILGIPNSFTPTNPAIPTSQLPPSTPLPRAELLGEMMHFPPTIDVLRPLKIDESDLSFHYSALIRLRPGATPAQAETALTVGASRVRLTPLHAQLTATARQPLLLFTAGALLLLCIIAVNFANLQLTRIASRRAELKLHAALGASPADLLRHTLAETAALLALSATAALALSAAGMRILVQSAPAFLPRLTELTVLPSAWALSLFITASAGAAAVALALWLPPNSTRRLQNAFTFSAAALSVALVSAAGLLLLSYARLRGGDHGFNPPQTVTFHIKAPNPAHHQEFLEKLRQLPGVIAAASSNRLPLQGEGLFNPLEQPDLSTPGPIAAWRVVSPGYFTAAGTTLLAGRDFTEEDRGQPLAIISLRVANDLFPGTNPIGQPLYEEIGQEKRTTRIIGVAVDVKARHIDGQAPPMVYVPAWQAPLTHSYYIVRTTAEPAQLLESIRQIAASWNLEMPPERVGTMQGMIDYATQPQRWQTYWTLGFAALGLVTACLGLFGSVRFQMSRRTAEIALRMALGATSQVAARMLLGESMRPVWYGVAAGVAAVIHTGQILEPQLYAVNPNNPWVLATSATAVILAALAAAYISIHRAVRQAPMAALRAD